MWSCLLCPECGLPVWPSEQKCTYDVTDSSLLYHIQGSAFQCSSAPLLFQISSLTEAVLRNWSKVVQFHHQSPEGAGWFWTSHRSVAKSGHASLPPSPTVKKLATHNRQVPSNFLINSCLASFLSQQWYHFLSSTLVLLVNVRTCQYWYMYLCLQ